MVEDFPSLAKELGIHTIAKAIVANGRSYSISEHEFVAAGNAEYGQAEFTKMIERDLILRKAIQQTKQAQWTKGMATLEPMQVGAAAATNVDDPADALAQLNQLAERNRRAGETIEQSFSREYTKPENAELVARERRQNRPQPRVSTAA